MVSLEENDARAKFHNNAEDDESIEVCPVCVHRPFLGSTRQNDCLRLQDPNEVFEITDFTTASDWER